MRRPGCQDLQIGDSWFKPNCPLFSCLADGADYDDAPQRNETGTNGKRPGAVGSINLGGLNQTVPFSHVSIEV